MNTRIMTDYSSWRESALCAQSDPALWYGDDAFSHIAAKTVCATCPVRTPCLSDGLDEHYGIWGGWSPEERKQLRKRIARLDAEARAVVLDAAAQHGPSKMKIHN